MLPQYSIDQLNFIITPNSQEVTVNDFLTANKSLLQKLVNNLIISEKIANTKKTKEQRKKLSLIIFSFIYLFLVKKQIQIDSNELINKNITEYLEDFKITCVKNTLICNNIEISFDTILLQLGISDLDGGIGAMTLEENTFDNIFTIY